MDEFTIDLNPGAISVIAVIGISYFILITAFGTYFSRFSKNINDFFYSGQRFAWWIAAASMVATGIGSYSYIKYSQQGFDTGLSSTMTYMNDWFVVPFFMFGWLPIIYFSRIKSIPEYFERRFSKKARYIAMVIILFYMFFYIGYNLFTIGVAINGLVGVPQIISIPILALFLGAYVTYGGQTAVIFTDLFQGMMLYVAGGLAILAGIVALGGFVDFWGYLPEAHRLPFVHLNADPKFNTSGLFWGEALAGSIAFAFMNQGFIMRYLTVKSVHEGRKAAFFNVAVTLPVSAIIVGAVGWIAKSLVVKQAVMGGVLEGINPIMIENSRHTFIIVAWETLHQNSILFGFVIAALTAALMSTIDTLINACAAVGIYDLYKPLIKPGASDKHYLKAARCASVIATVIGVLLVIVFNFMKGTLMSIHYKGIMIIIPSVVTTIFLGAFWKRFNARAATVSMIVGSISTVLVAVDFSGIPIIGSVIATIAMPLKWIMLHIAEFVMGNVSPDAIYMPSLFGMTLTAVVGITISMLTKPDTKDISGLTAGSLDEAIERYKGGKPNHDVGQKLRRIPVRIDEEIPFGEVRLSQSMMDDMKAKAEDLIYMEDSRWWLGGLRSNHVNLGSEHSGTHYEIAFSSATGQEAYLLAGRKVMIEKIF